MKNLIRILLLVLVTAALPAATTSSITQFGITFNFDTPVEHGQFADGSYWVQAPVTLTSITPSWDGTHNGWEVNPTVSSAQGFSALAPGGHFSASKMPAFPYVATTDQSIVKVIGRNRTTGNYCYVKTAAVLTVLVNIPPGGGSAYFRPAYIGSDKTLYAVASLNTELLPSFAPTTGLGQPTLESIVTKFSQCLRMDHHSNYPRYYRPSDCMGDYQPDNGNTYAHAMLRLMLDAPIGEKMPALIQYTQHTIDRAYAVLYGYKHGSSGHNPGHRIMAAWGAVMLDIPGVLERLADESVTKMHDRHVTKMGNGPALWGEVSTTTAYWAHVQNYNKGSKSNRDPYGYVDGGQLRTTGVFGAGASYQTITAQCLKGEVLCAVMMPELQKAYRPSHWPVWLEYVDRWVTHGVWAEPDPAAPYTSTGTYKVDYGPDPANPGQPILGSGRWPGLHGLNADGGKNRSRFVAAAWNSYRGAIVTPPPPEESPPVHTRGGG